MKQIIIGDTHGKPFWKEVLKKEKDFDKFIFIGDYFDSREYTGQQELDNFEDILEFKINNPDKVVLLYGNHEHHYISYGERYSGFQDGFAEIFSEKIKYCIEKDLIQMCYKPDEDTICIHAGLTKTFCSESGIYIGNIENELNAALKTTPELFNYNRMDNSNTGDDICQTPIWVRPNSLLLDCIDGFTQIVGHTKMEKVKNIGNIVFIDVLDFNNEYIVIEGNELRNERIS